jgi:hypothetical protein
MALSIASSTAHADDGDGYSATTLFTSIPGEQSCWVADAPRRTTIAIPNDVAARGYVTTSRRDTWLSPPAPDSGEH